MRAASQVGGIRVVGVMETSNYDLLEAFLGGESPKRGNGGEFNESLHFNGERIQLFRKEHNVELVRKTERRKEALPDRGSSSDDLWSSSVTFMRQFQRMENGNFVTPPLDLYFKQC